MPRLRTHPARFSPRNTSSLRPLGEWTGSGHRRPSDRITDIIRQRRDVSADTAIRLGKFFAVDPRFWLNLQTAYDLSRAENEHDYSSVRPRSKAPA